jgi:hypothetical protein
MDHQLYRDYSFKSLTVHAGGEWVGGGGWRVYGASDPNQYIEAKLALLLYTSGIQATNIIQCIQLPVMFDIVLNK